MASPTRLDVITIGRSSVDLYGQQIGGRLEDMASFAKSVGGSPTNTAIGAARLGLKAGVITRVGDEHMGRFIREQLIREGVAVDGVSTDRDRLTALVILGVRDDHNFPHIFYRADCADMALSEVDIDEAYVQSAGAVLVSGTHFSTPTVEAASHKAIRAAKAAGRKVVFDVDYRPNLWGLAGHGAGDNRYIRSEAVTRRLDAVVSAVDLIVGTEEELTIVGGGETMLDSVRRIRALTAATIVLKQGPMGCLVYPGAIPDRLEDGIRGPGFPVDVYNTLGAGDAFMAGFLRGWLRGEPIETTCAWANACGAIAVSRLLCSPEYPTFEELKVFFDRYAPAAVSADGSSSSGEQSETGGSAGPAKAAGDVPQGSRSSAFAEDDGEGSGKHVLRNDVVLNDVHWVETRRPRPDTLMALAIDHRSQLEAIADRVGAPREKIGRFKELAVEATARVADGRAGFGMLLDGTYGVKALAAAAGHPFWIGRPVERPGSRPLEFEGGGDLGAHLVEWPVIQTVKCLCFYHPDDPDDLKERQERALTCVFDGARTIGRELMIEIIAGKNGPVGDDTVARVLDRLYGLGIRPDWWKLEPQATAAAWAAIDAVIAAHDPKCRGVVMLGLEAPEAELVQGFAVAARAEQVKGFAVGRTIFAEAAAAWLADRIDDEAAIDDMAARFSKLVAAWRSAIEKERAA